jgi:chromosome segregation ATPase
MFFKKDNKNELDKDMETNNSNNNKSKTNLSPEIKIEKLEAQVGVLKDTINAFQEKFTINSEKFGELRNMIINIEKKIGTIEMKAEKASALVEDVQPQKFLTLINKQKLITDTIYEKYSIIENKNNEIQNQFNGLKNEMKSFRGINDIMKLSKEVKDELITIKRIEANTEKHADKVESIYYQSLKKQQIIEDIAKEQREINTKIKTFEKDFEKMKIRLDNTSTKDEIEKSKSEIFNMHQKTKELVEQMENSEDELEKIIDGHKSLKNEKEIIAKLHKLEQNINDLNKNYISKSFDKTKSELNKISKSIRDLV